MAAYLVIINNTHNFEGLVESGYPKRSISLAEQFGAIYRHYSKNAEMIEGDAKWNGARPIIIEFPDTESARNFWFSPEYQEIRKLREPHCELMAFLTDRPWMNENDAKEFIGSYLK